ncbi:hypothetical protein OG782_31450 [Streptomyces sp. NBC_00876]|uniref:site-specific integrase n=1 Tax=Streptomyces sp. NBC_00876 TaxID=2975853 RepID=UPI00386F6937|nr:hypothetical protein OG782_31450 [Streptomyces sp. NBC_00876]
MSEPKKIVLASGKVRYRAVIGIGRHESGKRGQLTITKDTAKEVTAEISRIENEQNTRTFVPPHLLTVNQWIDQWLDKKAEDLEETAICNYRITLDRCRGQLGSIKLQELTEEDVEAWMLWSLKAGRLRGPKAGSGLGVTSVDMSLARLKDVQNRAVTERLVTMNVASELGIPRKARKAGRRTKAQIVPWNVTEAHALVGHMKSDRLYAPLLLSLMGLRPAEVVGIRWSDIDLTTDTLTVANTRTMMGTKHWWRRTPSQWQGNARSLCLSR